MLAAAVVPEGVEGNRLFQVLDLLAEGVGEPG
jgi:hypothetical protein